ncbi:MAG: phosphate ABC transporter ATP-binding protein [Lachnospiraceae bacterium]|nr:phosphate ABC transporter ATP-binding protein [Lachnospiraceae bacterium]
MSENNIKIEIKNFSFYYGQKQVIHDLNLKIHKNEIMSFFGPANGGVTTLLRSLNRLFELNHNTRSEGDILIDGESIFDPDASVTELRRKVGMVFEIPTPLPLSIFDNVAYGPRLNKKKSKDEINEVVEQAIKQAALWDDVSDRLRAPAMSLSGGQQQRLCIARVLALKPEVIILDRACSGLDPISTAKIEESLTKLKKQFTIVIAPHNVQQAMRISDRAAFMLMGYLVEAGADIFTHPQDQRTDDYITGRFG